MSMEIKKPKLFVFRKTEAPEVTLWGNHLDRPVFRVERFNDCYLYIGNERWDVKLSGLNVHMEPVLVNGVFINSRISFDPIRIEFYNRNTNVLWIDSELGNWVHEINDTRDFAQYGRFKRDIIIEKINDNSQFLLRGSLLQNYTVNAFADDRYNIDPILECEIVFDRYEIL